MKDDKADKKTDKDDSEILTEIRDFKEKSEEIESDIRDSYQEDTNFEAGDQWDDADKTDRENNSRPCLTINKTAGVTKQIVGESRQNKMGIKVRPVDSEDDKGKADIFTGLIRNIENTSRAENAYNMGSESAIRGGFGYWRIVTEYAGDDTFDQDIKIKRIVNPLSVYFGKCVEADNSDATGCIIEEEKSVKEFEAEYPDAKPMSTYDIESDDSWADEDEIVVAEYFKKTYKDRKLVLLSNGQTVKREDLEEEQYNYLKENDHIERERTAKVPKIVWYKTNGYEILEGPEEWAGKYIPIIPIMGEEVWVDGKKELRSAIKWAKEPARLYNWSRSNAAETLALAPKQPFILTQAEIDGHEDQWAVAHKKPMPYLLHNPSQMGRPTRQPASMTDTGAMTESLQAADDLKATTGLYDASLGARGNETSGKAINARAQQGEVSTFIYSDNKAGAMTYTGVILVDLIPYIFDTERVVRLLNEDGSEAWAEINVKDPLTGEIHNDLSVGKFDVVVDVGPAYATKRLEATDGMIQLVTAAPEFAPIIVPKIAKNSDWPESEEIAEEMMQMNQGQQGGQEQPQQPAPPDPAAQAKVQIEMEKGKMDLQGKEMDLKGKEIDLQGKQIELQSDKLELTQQGREGQEHMQQMAQVAQDVTVKVLQQLGLIT